mmetsp:Transcript_91722/g.165604  ORF Transcript_91722/g.165604 Transcript_91722/m.165604 type:complete len:241 (-) Transcript_91722:550-1272(-)
MAKHELRKSQEHTALQNVVFFLLTGHKHQRYEEQPSADSRHSANGCGHSCGAHQAFERCSAQGLAASVVCKGNNSCGQCQRLGQDSEDRHKVGPGEAQNRTVPAFDPPRTRSTPSLEEGGWQQHSQASGKCPKARCLKEWGSNEPSKRQAAKQQADGQEAAGQQPAKEVAEAGRRYQDALGGGLHKEDVGLPHEDHGAQLAEACHCIPQLPKEHVAQLLQARDVGQLRGGLRQADQGGQK